MIFATARSCASSALAEPENVSSVVRLLTVAPSGRGKSYETKREIASLLLEGVDVRVVDLENEYIRLAEALGGAVVRPGAGVGQVNPFELAEAGEAAAVVRQALFVEALVATLVGSLGPEEQACLGRAILSCYRLKEIGSDPATHDRRPPEMLDLLAALEGPERRLMTVQAPSASKERGCPGKFDCLLHKCIPAHPLGFAGNALAGDALAGNALGVEGTWSPIEGATRRRAGLRVLLDQGLDAVAPHSSAVRVVSWSMTNAFRVHSGRRSPGRR